MFSGLQVRTAEGDELITLRPEMFCARLTPEGHPIDVRVQDGAWHSGPVSLDMIRKGGSVRHCKA
ncbi:hypothetical protein SCOCK_250015 [Actinacidiphila cocklensis]|uniref:Uncharacterized protein n=1 Tax=Actinacidiphila cocklensis TaxID=887465 RepID=A0A9W4DQ40_9ACTN|nr:hypothetical protein SCOCK_250015 [Actinacidiphila cocklensis]